VARAYLHISIPELLVADEQAVLGELAQSHPFALEPAQRDAWLAEIANLKRSLVGLRGAAFLELEIPRMGRRADVVLFIKGTLFVVEYKVGATQHDASAIRQCLDYALDLKYFHSTSHTRRIVPILVATRASAPGSLIPAWLADDVATPVRATPESLRTVIDAHLEGTQDDGISGRAWLEGAYKPTPTIVEAARALYDGHRVEAITRSEAGAENLARTAAAIDRLIEQAKAEKQKTICFLTGVPGSGKTLAGLNIATQRMRAHHDEHAVFLSGNGPLVAVLREALVRDDLRRNPRRSKEAVVEGVARVKAFIQNIHHFRDDNLKTTVAPAERVAVFDEAQRAWDRAQTSKFMRTKRNLPNFDMSEPEFLLSVMDRHPDWCVVVCLVGDGQEINTGEVGIGEWFRALRERFPHWLAVFAPQAKTLDHGNGEAALDVQHVPALHLEVSVRSFRAESMAAFADALVAGDPLAAREQLKNLGAYPVVLTRDIAKARAWLRGKARGSERIGLVASSNAQRLKPIGIHVKAKIDPLCWFLNEPEDVRSSFALEDTASEFDVQGLELDWVGVCWDANYRYSGGGWSLHEFRGTAWQSVGEGRQDYLRNAYRVLLTRARQGMVLLVPEGDAADETRLPSYYDGTFAFLRDVGIPLL
jgi:hypothetical protein